MSSTLKLCNVAARLALDNKYCTISTITIIHAVRHDLTKLFSRRVGGMNQWRIHGGNRPLPSKRARNIFLNVSENKSSDRKLSLIPFVSSTCYVE